MASVGQPLAGNSGPEFYDWEIAGKPVSVRLDLDVVDRISNEAMRGFGGARRGLEVGGILLGTVTARERGSVVHITDYEAVSPAPESNRFEWKTESERLEFEQAVSRWTWQPGKTTYAVGFYRSHNREDLGVTDLDIEQFNRHFPDPSAVMLLVKPYATRASAGGLFFREEGGMRREASYREFPFRTRELKKLSAEQAAGGSSPTEGATVAGEIPSMATATNILGIGSEVSEPMPTDELKYGIPTATQEQDGRRLRSGWVWIPLSFIFLLLGVVLGFQVALSVRSHMPAGFRQDPYALNLSISPAGDSLHVRWDRTSPAIVAATRGWLIIKDGGGQKTVDLDVAQLQNGSVIYRRASGDIQFRLEVLAGNRVTVGESLDYNTNRAK